MNKRLCVYEAWEKYWEEKSLPDETFIAPGYVGADEICEFAFRLVNDSKQECDALRAENARLCLALHDAIRRPMGIVPDSAVEFYSQEEAEKAEVRRLNDC